MQTFDSFRADWAATLASLQRTVIAEVKYKPELHDLVGKINAEPFGDYPAGTLLLIGIDRSLARTEAEFLVWPFNHNWVFRTKLYEGPLDFGYFTNEQGETMYKAASFAAIELGQYSEALPYHKEYRWHNGSNEPH